jgi:hypothetical protein
MKVDLLDFLIWILLASVIICAVIMFGAMAFDMVKSVATDSPKTTECNTLS